MEDLTKLNNAYISFKKSNHKKRGKKKKFADFIRNIIIVSIEHSHREESPTPAPTPTPTPATPPKPKGTPKVRKKKKKSLEEVEQPEKVESLQLEKADSVKESEIVSKRAGETCGLEKLTSVSTIIKKRPKLEEIDPFELLTMKVTQFKKETEKLLANLAKKKGTK